MKKKKTSLSHFKDNEVLVWLTQKFEIIDLFKKEKRKRVREKMKQQIQN